MLSPLLSFFFIIAFFTLLKIALVRYDDSRVDDEGTPLSKRAGGSGVERTLSLPGQIRDPGTGPLGTSGGFWR